MPIRNLLFDRSAHDRKTDLGLLVLRVVAGLSLALFHGIGKVPPQDGLVGMVGGMGFPAPALFAWVAGLTEFGGGLLLAAGLLARPTALLLVVHFLIVFSVAHGGDPIGDRELPMLFWSIAFLFLMAGPGRYSLDGAFAARR